MNRQADTMALLSRPGLWRWVRKMVCRRVPSQDADDVVQTIALRAVTHAGQYDADKGKVTTWLRWMIIEATRHYHKQRGRNACEGLLCGLAQCREPRPDDAVMASESAGLVRSAVNRLPRRSREVMELHMRGMKCTEIGRRIGRTKQAAVHRLARAKGLLRVELTCPLRSPSSGRSRKPAFPPG